jgi:GTP-binding protein
MSAPLKMEFVTSAAELHQLPDSRAEIAVVGRSNVGKSSLLNALARRKDLAKVSSKPGRTQLLNCFAVGDGALLIDLPGYGYASTASKQTRAGWHRRMERYLLERDELALVFLLIDAEVGPTRLDLEMLAWLRSYTVPFQIVATKHDKVKSAKRQRRKRDLAAGCGVEPGDVIWVSAEKNVGIDRLRDAVRAVLDLA